MSIKSTLPAGTKLPHMIQLDGLRGFAVLAVLVHHYGGLCFKHEFEYAALSGVKLFFVLSGFLITGILLKARNAADASGLPVLPAIKRFYIRRFLRIFPLYYFVVFVALLLNVEPARKIVWWLLSYTLNIHMGLQGWFENNFAHFWSLSVEEQFYVFWPWIVFFTPRKWLIPVLVAAISISPLQRMAYILSDYTNMTGIATYIDTRMCLDSLGCGSLLAILVQRCTHQASLQKQLDRFLLPASLLGVVLAQLVWKYSQWWQPGFLVHDTLQSLLFCWLVARASWKFQGWAGAVLQWKPITYCGKISYGIYVYHPFVPVMLGAFLGRAYIDSYAQGILGFVTATLLAIGISSASWFALEKPINDLKSRFED
jgi:peptidoglycan/LPS O-acetylase OafA/YrhL